MLNGQTVLIVEAEFLIALDIQHMLEDLSAGDMLFARAVNEVLAMTPKWPEISLAIVELDADSARTSALVSGLCAAGVSVILTTTDSALAGRKLAIPDLPVVVKPMSQADFRMAVDRALADRSSQPA